MKNIFKFSHSIFSIILSVLSAVFLVSIAVFAATTIDLNISTGGSLTVSGTSATSTFSTGGLAIGTSQFIVQQSSGKVGIGTTSPANNFHVFGYNSPAIKVESGSDVSDASFIAKGPSGITSPVFVAFVEGSGAGPSPNGYWEVGYLASGNYLYFAGGNTYVEKMVITDAGKVGIGTTSPGTLFGVQGDIVGAGRLTVSSISATSSSATSNVSGNLTIGGNLAVSGTSTLTGVSSGFVTSSNNIAGSGLLNISGTGTSTITGKFEVTGAILAESGQRVCTSGNGICGGTASGTINTGTANSVAYYPSTGTTVDDVSFLSVDTTNNRLGIGTSTPYASLSVVGKAVFDSFTATSSSATSTINGGLSILGTLGIGTTAPGAKLQIEGVSNNAAVRLRETTSSIYAYLGFVDTSGNFAFDLIGNNYMSFTTNSTGRMLITGAGNIGIGGTTTPWGRLGITGADTSTTNALVVADSLDTPRMVVQNSGNVGIGTSSPFGRLSIKGAGSSSGKGFVFADSGNAIKFVVQDDGNVGIGVSNPQTTLEVLGTASTTDLMISNKAGVGTSTPAKTFSLVGDSYQSSNATTTLFIKSTGASRNGCIELEGPSDIAYRLYITDAGGTPALKVEAGTCK